MINKKLKSLIRSGDFSEAEALFKSLNMDELYQTLMELGFEKDSDLSPYLFVLELLFHNEDAKLHNIASALLCNPFCWMPGAYNVAMEHLQKAIKMNPNNIRYKQGMLLFYQIPEKLITLEDAVGYAREVLEVEPDDKISKGIMERFNNNI